MFNNQTTISDITFIGSGISTSFTLINLVEKLAIDKPSKALKIIIIDKFQEFFNGIPYGMRSGKSVLLINSLRSFLPETERQLFINWLKKNKKELITNFLEAGEIEAERWLQDNDQFINKNEWDDLYVPRSFFGEYINRKVKKVIEEAENKSLINVSLVVSEVVDLIKHAEFTEVKLSNTESIFTKKTILCVGSLPSKKIEENSFSSENSNLLLINDIYKKTLDSNFKKIQSFLLNRKANGTETNVLIIGANASSLETIYKLQNNRLIKSSISKYFVLSTHGIMPDSETNHPLKHKYLPKNLIKLKEIDVVSAKEISNAAFKDIDLAEKSGLGAASSVDIISSEIGKLLEKLSINELRNFACLYGNEIGRRQRCAGYHYTSVIDHLKSSNKFIHIAGRHFNLIKQKNGTVKEAFLDSKTHKKVILSENFNVVINCMGSVDLESDLVPELLNKLIEKDYVVRNKSNIGFSVNDNLEASKDLYICGPLLAGNVISKKPLWHLEHCGRIIWISKILGNHLAQTVVNP